jgi:hypothetical protein
LFTLEYCSLTWDLQRIVAALPTIKFAIENGWLQPAYLA